jgi:hypothetical protein
MEFEERNNLPPYLNLQGKSSYWLDLGHSPDQTRNQATGLIEH